MALLRLPNEILFKIGENLSIQDLYSLIQCNIDYFAIFIRCFDKLVEEKYPSTALFWAVASGNRQMATQLLLRGKNIRIIDNDTILFKSGDEVDSSIVELVIEKATSLLLRIPWEPGLWGGPEIIYDCGDGEEEEEEEEEDDDDDDDDDEGGEEAYMKPKVWSALHWAVFTGKENLVKRLVERGADVLHRDIENRTPLHLAAWTGNEIIIRHLIKNNTAVQLEAIGDFRNTSALHFAIRSRNANAVKLLLESGANVEQKENDDMTPLLLEGVCGSSPAIAGLLLDHGADINSQNKAKDTALHQAIWYGRDNLAKFLIERGADLNIINLGGEQPIHIAARDYPSRMVQLLLDNGAETTLINRKGETLLHIAISAGNRGLAKLCLKKNYQIVNWKNRDGETALHLAILRVERIRVAEKVNSEKLIKFLIENGADTCSITHGGEAPIDLQTRPLISAEIQKMLDPRQGKY